MSNSITSYRDFQSFKIFINGLLHIEIRMDNHDGIQSWYDGTTKKVYYIEFYRKIGNPIRCGYDLEENWRKILELINENI